jgi:prepilin-type N-terminal cleavage/methylation domain-containing protein
MKRAPFLRSGNGLTLIELLVGVAILGLTLAMAVPSMRGYAAKHRVSAINAELVADLYLARTEAVQRNQWVQVIFDADLKQSCYSIVAGLTPNQPCNCRRGATKACFNNQGQSLGATEIKTVSVPTATDVQIVAPAAPGNLIQYTPPRGIPLQGNSLSVTVKSRLSDGGQLRTVSNMVGRQTVCSPDGSIAGVPTCID